MDERQDSLADREIERMRRGPTSVRSAAPALLAEMYELLHEASDFRRTAIFAIETMRNAVPLENHLLGQCSSLPASPAASGQHALDAAAERAAMAEAASSHDHAPLNAMTLVSMFGAVEGMVEGIGPDLHRHLEEQLDDRLTAVEAQLNELLRLVEAGGSGDPDLHLRRRAALLLQLEERVREGWPVVRDRLAKLPPVARWEDALTPVRLGAPRDRPLPTDLVVTLNELGHLRNALLHRRGRVDAKLRRQAPGFTENMPDGALIRVNGKHFRLFVAAIWTYAEEIACRAGLHGPAALESWRENYTACD